MNTYRVRFVNQDDPQRPLIIQYRRDGMSALEIARDVIREAFWDRITYDEGRDEACYTSRLKIWPVRPPKPKTHTLVVDARNLMFKDLKHYHGSIVIFNVCLQPITEIKCEHWGHPETLNVLADIVCQTLVRILEAREHGSGRYIDDPKALIEQGLVKPVKLTVCGTKVTVKR